VGGLLLKYQYGNIENYVALVDAHHTFHHTDQGTINTLLESPTSVYLVDVSHEHVEFFIQKSGEKGELAYNYCLNPLIHLGYVGVSSIFTTNSLMGSCPPSSVTPYYGISLVIDHVIA